MKWVFYVIVFIYMFYRAVYGTKNNELGGITVETVKYDSDKNFLLPGSRKTINCIAAHKNQKMEWIDPTGNPVKRNPANRVFVQESLVSASKFPLSVRTRVPALGLVFTSAAVEDTGVWECQAGDNKQNISLCVIDPSRFGETSTVTVDSGRSITLSCQAKGDPEPRILWYRNGEIITDDRTPSKYQIMTKYNSLDSEGLLTIMSLGAEDSGAYTCEAVQESPFVDDCNHVESMNVSLQVNHAPVFKDGNDTKFVYGTDGESLDLVCSASGHPIPTFKWLKDVEETSFEFGQDKIQLLNDGAEAVLTLAPNTYYWNQRYRCRAINQYGEVDKSFLLLKTEKPMKPSAIQPHSESADKIQLKVTWNNEINFPVQSIDVQYIKVKSLKGRKPKESDWARSKLEELNPDNVDFEGLTVYNLKLKPDNFEFEGLNVTLPDLDENTKYCIRLRAVNTVGESQWSKSIQASTVEKPEVPEELEEEEQEEPEDTTAESATAHVSDSTFYGIFFAGGIAVIAVGSMFLMRLV